MKVLTAIVFLGLLACGSAKADAILFHAGVACQPATASDADELDFRDGSARNIHAAPGTADQNATVVCQLPAVPPGTVMTGASVTYYDDARRWGKCYFLNAWPATPSRAVLVTSVADRPWIGTADLPVDAASFVPQAVRLAVMPDAIGALIGSLTPLSSVERDGLHDVADKTAKAAAGLAERGADAVQKAASNIVH